MFYVGQKASESTTSSSCCSSLRKAASSRRAAIASTEPCPPSPEASLPSGRSMDGERCVSVPMIEKGEAPASLALPARRGVACSKYLAKRINSHLNKESKQRRTHIRFVVCEICERRRLRSSIGLA